MKSLSLVLVGILLAASLSFAAEEGGEAIFKSLGCMSCHNPEKASKVNPSLVEISQAYQGNPERLINYLGGQEEAVVRPEKSGMMKRYVEKTKALTDAQRASLADFIIGFK